MEFWQAGPALPCGPQVLFEKGFTWAKPLEAASGTIFAHRGDRSMWKWSAVGYNLVRASKPVVA